MDSSETTFEYTWKRLSAKVVFSVPQGRTLLLLIIANCILPL